MGAAAARGVLIGIVNKNQIQVGIVIQLTATHLAHAQNAESALGNDTEFSLQLVESQLQGALDDGVGEIRKLL